MPYIAITNIKHGQGEFLKPGDELPEDLAKDQGDYLVEIGSAEYVEAKDAESAKQQARESKSSGQALSEDAKVPPTAEELSPQEAETNKSTGDAGEGVAPKSGGGDEAKDTDASKTTDAAKPADTKSTGTKATTSTRTTNKP